MTELRFGIISDFSSSKVGYCSIAYALIFGIISDLKPSKVGCCSITGAPSSERHWVYHRVFDIPRSLASWVSITAEVLAGQVVILEKSGVHSQSIHPFEFHLTREWKQVHPNGAFYRLDLVWRSGD